jgi:hypothetical protein
VLCRVKEGSIDGRVDGRIYNGNNKIQQRKHYECTVDK